jgi:hypothetical protein
MARVSGRGYGEDGIYVEPGRGTSVAGADRGAGRGIAGGGGVAAARVHRLCLPSGVRAAEARALTWDHVDLGSARSRCGGRSGHTGIPR